MIESVSAESPMAAVELLREALEGTGMQVIETAGRDDGADVTLGNPAGGDLLLAIKRMSLASRDLLAGRLDAWNAELAGTAVAGLLVADRVTNDARFLLHKAGWGWLDLRGHLHVAGPGLFVDTDVPALKPRPGRSAPLAGRVALEVAAHLLLDPDEPVGVRRLAARLGRAPSSVSEAIASLHEAGLLDARRRPAIPELFWELAARWDSPTADLASTPAPGEDAVDRALRIGRNISEGVGWALSETLAAAAYGAPVGIRSDHPGEFYVPDASTLRRAVQLLGAAPDHTSRRATIRVAPVPIICAERVPAPQDGWPLAQPLFVALDLARDPGRGAEILSNWTPPQAWHRVW